MQNKLTVKRIEALDAGTHGDGGGLWLRKTAAGSATWILRYQMYGKTRQMGLGGYPAISLAAARKLRDKWAEQIAEGKDPIAVREREAKAAKSQMLTLDEVAKSAFEARKAELKGDGKAGRWFGPLKIHILPKLGKRPAVEITQIDVRDALRPIWKEKADTARKASNRLDIVLRHAAALGLDVDLQAVEKAKLLLGKQDHKSERIAAMPWKNVPKFYATLSDGSLTHLALRFLILNPGPRSKPIRYLQENQIDGDVWTVPGELMKGQKGKVDDWRTPLAPQSLEVLAAVRPLARNGNLFPNISGRGVMSDATLSRYMERAKLDYRPHGFRSSFRTWAAETGQRQDIAELCNAHKIFKSVEAAYVRTDFLAERRELLNKWADFVTGVNADVGAA